MQERECTESRREKYAYCMTASRSVSNGHKVRVRVSVKIMVSCLKCVQV